MKNEKKPLPLSKIIIALTLLSVAATVILYPSLPARIPYHWSITGTVRTAGKWITLVMASLPVIIFYTAKFRPKQNQSESYTFVICLLFIIIHWVIIFIAK